MFDRFYVIRDDALLQYNGPDDKLPTRIIPLRGLYINKIKDGPDGLTGFEIISERENFVPIKLYSAYN